MPVVVFRSVSSIATATGMAVLAALSSPGVASAHNGEDAAFSHVLIDVGQWGLGVTAVAAVLVGALWLRARAMRRGE